MSNEAYVRVYADPKILRRNNIVNSTERACNNIIQKAIRLSDKNKTQIEFEVSLLRDRIKSEMSSDLTAEKEMKVMSIIRNKNDDLNITVEKMLIEENETRSSNLMEIETIVNDLRELNYGQSFDKDIKSILNETNKVRSCRDIYEQKKILEELNENKNRIIKRVTIAGSMHLDELKEDTVGLDDQKSKKNINFIKSEKAKNIIEMINKMDEEACEENLSLLNKIVHSSDPNEINANYSQLLFNYGKIKNTYVSTKIYKEKLRVLKDDLYSAEYKVADYVKLQKEVKVLIEKKTLTKDDLAYIEDDIEKFLFENDQRRRLKEKLNILIKNVKKDGWLILDEVMFDKMLKGDKIDMTKGEYVVRMGFKNGNLETKYLKKSSKRKSKIGDIEIKEDVKSAKKWCQTFNKILEELDKEGVSFKDIKRIEPNENNIEYEFVEEQSSVNGSEISKELDKKREL
jgi:hypothetical protein